MQCGISLFKEFVCLFFKIKSIHRHERRLAVLDESQWKADLTVCVSNTHSSALGDLCPSIPCSHLMVCAHEFMVHSKFKTIISDSFCSHKIFSIY